MVLNAGTSPPPRPAATVSPWLRACAHLAALLPALWLAWQIADVWRHGSDALGPDPVAAIEHHTGLWALRLLLLTLAITPLRRLGAPAQVLQLRRLVGLYAFFYASLHLAAYLVLDLGGYWTQIFEEIAKRPYITVGFSAWLLLIPLAITSTRGWMRRLGRRWGQLHRVVYAIGILAVLHFWWLVKSDLREPAIYVAILALLLGLRLWWRFNARRTKARH